MARPKADRRQLSLFARCIDPAGASPAPVSTGAPGSRPQAQGESLCPERGVPQGQAGALKSLYGGSKYRSWHGVKDVREIVKVLNPVLRGWGNYFRTGNATQKFKQLDTHVWNRLRAFMVKRKGRNLRAGEARLWDPEFFHRLGLHRLRGTVKYPEIAQC